MLLPRSDRPLAIGLPATGGVSSLSYCDGSHAQAAVRASDGLTVSAFSASR